MKYHSARNIVLAFAMVALLLGVVGTAGVLAQGPETVVITNPAEGEMVSGVVVVTGAIDFPDFLKYDFFLSNSGNMIWVATGYSPVINGNILRLDTKTHADGAYRIVIRKVTTDSNYTDTYGPTFNISNGQTAPNATPEVEATFLYPAPGKATVRVRNCTSEDFFTDYGSPEGFKDAGKITLAPRAEGAPVCPYADIALTPGEYRGTAKGGAQVKGWSYTLHAEAGKVYQMTYNGPAAGAATVYIAEIQPDERAGTDTAALNLDDPARTQSAEKIQTTTVPAPEQESMAEATDSGDAAASDDAQADSTILPVSGQAAQPKTPFAIVAVGLLGLMIVGGFVAIRRGKRTT